MKLQDDWDRHWEHYSQTAERNPAQNYRRELVFKLLGIRDDGKGARLLDIGSGQGDMATALRSRYPAAEILGLELSHSGVEIARNKVPTARFIQRNLLEELDLAKDLRGWATHAICAEVIEHVDNPFLLLKNARSYMTDGSCLVLTAPGGPMSEFDRHIGHRKHWRRDDIEALLRASGYAPEFISGAGFPFFNLYRRLVILRGKKLIEDAKSGETGTFSLPARVAMVVFHWLIRPTLNSSRWGWQMIAKARPS